MNNNNHSKNRAITLFDIYQEPPIPEEKKGIPYRIRYQANDRTLTDKEVNQTPLSLKIGKKEGGQG
jgi:phenylalanyl-tRNA synthetase beta chain